MIFKRKKIMSILFALFMVFNTFSPSIIALSATLQDVEVPQEATAYAYKNYEGAIETAKKYIDWYDVTEEQLNDVKIGQPFVIYEINDIAQDEIYYYPILDSKKEIVLLMCVIGTTDGWSFSVSEEWVDELNQIGDITSDYIFYKSDTGLYAENKKEEFCVEGNKDLEIKEFSEKSYQAKKNIINDAIENFKKTDLSELNNIEECKVDKYVPSFSSSSTSSKICKLYNQQGQGRFQLCWAATIATICNYRLGTDYTAQEVADTVNIGYNEGASPGQSYLALYSMGVSYSVLNQDRGNLMSWNSLRTNIDMKFPVYVSSISDEGGHAVTAYGYMIAAGTRYVAFWNSGNETSMTVEFKETGTVFTYNNFVYMWRASISHS